MAINFIDGLLQGITTLNHRLQSCVPCSCCLAESTQTLINTLTCNMFMLTHMGCLEMLRFGAMGDHQPQCGISPEKSLWQNSLSYQPHSKTLKPLIFSGYMVNPSEKKNTKNPAETVALAHNRCSESWQRLRWQMAVADGLTMDLGRGCANGKGFSSAVEP